MERKTCSIRLEPEIHKRIKVLAVSQDKYISEFIEEAVQEKLEREDNVSLNNDNKKRKRK